MKIMVFLLPSPLLERYAISRVLLGGNGLPVHALEGIQTIESC